MPVKKIRIQSYINLISKKIKCFSNSELIEIIGSQKYAEIKKVDSSPFFQVYSICHEGVSFPKILGEEGPRKISWPRKAIQSISNVIKNGVKFFRGHNEDSSTVNRQPLGEVVGNTQKEIDGILHHIVVAYHPPEMREEAKKYNVCSQESEWTFFEKAGRLIADKLEEITGIALGNSDTDTPAFSGAVRLGMVQAFADQRKKPEGNPGINKEVKKMPITFNDVVQAIKDLNVHPSQLFSLDKIKQDNNFVKEFEKLENENKTLKDQTEKLTKEKTEFETKMAEYTKKEQALTVKNRMSEIAKAMNLTEKENTFISKMYQDGVDPSDEGLKKFIEHQRNVFKEAIALGGVQSPDVNFATGDDKKDSPKDDTEKYTDPKFNDLIDAG